MPSKVPRGKALKPLRKPKRIRVRCLGPSDKEHWFWTTSKALRRCEKCERKVQSALLSPRETSPPIVHCDPIRLS